MTTLAIVSPNLNAVSETFVQAHRRLLQADIRFYFDGLMPRQLDGRGPLRSERLLNVIADRMRRKFLFPELDVDQLALLRSFVKEGIEVVLAEFGTPGVAVLPVCKRLGLPLIVHFHGFDASVRSVLEQYSTRYRELFDYSAAVVVVSRLMERTLAQLGCPREKLVYNVYGPDDKFFGVDPVEETVPRFVAVGRFVDKKAPHCVLLSFRKVLGRFPDAKLTMIGDGPLWEICNNLARHFGMEGSVVFAGSLSPDRVREVFSRSIAFVQHSVAARNGDSEGTPVAILEAMAAGLPVVATRHAGIIDIVEDGETGFLVDEHDVVGMAERMCRLLVDPALARTLGERGRQAAREQFSMSRHIEQLDALIRRVGMSNQIGRP